MGCILGDRSVQPENSLKQEQKDSNLIQNTNIERVETSVSDTNIIKTEDNKELEEKADSLDWDKVETEENNSQNHIEQEHESIPKLEHEEKHFGKKSGKRRRKAWKKKTKEDEEQVQ